MYGRTSGKDISLQDALICCVTALSQDSETIALLYSPNECQFAKLQMDATLTKANGEAVKLNYVFEARVFNEQSELRWLNKTNGQGQAVIISNQKLSSCLDLELEELEAIATLEQTYLLWGKRTNSSVGDHWTRLATPRLGAFDVPIVLSSSYPVELKAVEYLVEDNFGNVVVAEERLVKLQEKQ
ncbi:CRISPR-associated protein Csx19 [Leptolyngbya sp. FACHB-711]|uniref:type III-D CRISPR-associated protein Csx19 n=1 Tax=Leptolyngbya sp. FACHB-711 TaxID=2692813 RepID=UPI001682B78B|nr:CRISPR-associated protein Csx19 [Leptolyngbya sp. FACHB-711]MBD2028257.1 TIGR03984 family CRISPR-associated protein [Leptolyngbya sp. FACHB-711]